MAAEADTAGGTEEDIGGEEEAEAAMASDVAGIAGATGGAGEGGIPLGEMQ